MVRNHRFYIGGRVSLRRCCTLTFFNSCVMPCYFSDVCCYGVATVIFWAERYGCSCLRRTSARVTLSSAVSCSKGVSFIFSRLRCISFSPAKIFGYLLIMSSRKSVMISAARLYLCLDWKNLS